MMRGPDTKFVRLSRRLRVNQTRAESLLWKHLRNRQLAGFKFVRQEPISRYICDFVCRERLLIVEVDGGQHNESLADLARDRVLKEMSYRVLRFWNNDVLQNVEGVTMVLESALRE